MNDYEAKKFYQKIKNATDYESQYQTPLSLANFRARAIDWGERRAFLYLLRQVPESKSVLDIACGTGRYLEILLKKGFQVGGIDISEEMLAFARQRLQEYKNLMFTQRGDAEQLPFESQQFDLVTCMRLYHRIPADIRRRMLSEVKRVGTGKALLFFGMSTPYLKIRHTLRDLFIPGRPSNPFPLTMEQLRQELASVGLQYQDSKWVLPFLGEGLMVYVTW